jgi:hypothetical protein
MEYYIAVKKTEVSLIFSKKASHQTTHTGTVVIFIGSGNIALW